MTDDLWSLYGKSLKLLDGCRRHFAATLHRETVFESAIRRILQQVQSHFTDTHETQTAFSTCACESEGFKGLSSVSNIGGQVI